MKLQQSQIGRLARVIKYFFDHTCDLEVIVAFLHQKVSQDLCGIVPYGECVQELPN